MGSLPQIAWGVTVPAHDAVTDEVLVCDRRGVDRPVRPSPVHVVRWPLCRPPVLSASRRSSRTTLNRRDVLGRLSWVLLRWGGRLTTAPWLINRPERTSSSAAAGFNARWVRRPIIHAFCGA